MTASPAEWIAAPVLFVAASWRAVAWLRDCRRRARTACEVLRVAAEVLRQASILQRELADLGPHPRAALYRLQCEALRARAELALEHPARVRQLSPGRLLRALSRMHNDLRKLKGCRDELLVAASLWPITAGAGTPGRLAPHRAGLTPALGA